MSVHPIDVSINCLNGSVFVKISGSQTRSGAQEVLYLSIDSIDFNLKS